MHSVGNIRVVLAAALMVVAVMPAQSQPPCPVIPSLAVDGIPDDVCQHEPRDYESFANMAWQTFKMLVWPAASRGVAATDRNITDMKGARVFETYKSDWETFLAKAERPLDWDLYPTKADACANVSSIPPLSDGSLVLASLNKFGNVTQTDVARDSKNADIEYLLVAQNGSLVRYLPAFGKKAFDLIQTNKLYQSLDMTVSDDPPKGKTKTSFGTMTIKSAWIEIKNGLPDPSSFYWRYAWVQDPSDGSCKEAPVALVGLHITHKTVSSPQWIWASFEHVKNAPLRHSPPVVGYTFNDGSGSDMLVDPPLNARIPMNPFVIPPPYNVEQWVPTAKAIENVNGNWQKMLRDAGSVWTNYKLVVVEWPGIPNAGGRTGSGRDKVGKPGAYPTPPCLKNGVNLANTVMETFLQPDIVCKGMTTCMSCHNNARNYDFIWSIPLNSKDPLGALGLSQTRESALSILRQITSRNAPR